MTRGEEIKLQTLQGTVNGFLRDTANAQGFDSGEAMEVLEVARDILEQVLTEELDDEPLAPDPEDYFIYDVGPLGSLTALAQVEGGWIRDFTSEEEAIAYAYDQMKHTNFYPDLWRLSDHGNWHLIEKDEQ